MKILHLLVSGGYGGIEILMKHYALHSRHANHFTFLWSGGTVAEQLKARGAPVTVLDIQRDGLPVTLWKIEKLYQSGNFDAVVTHHRAPALKLAMLWLKWRHPRLRALAYAHSAVYDICEEYRPRGLWLRRLIHRAAYRAADGVVAISQFVKKNLTDKLQIPAEKVAVIYNGVPIPAKPPAFRQNVPPRLIYIGRLAREKGVQNILRALAAMPADLNYTFHIVGDGPELAQLQQQTAEWNLAHRVQFLGFRENTANLLAEADIFVHAPQWEEGFCLAAVEALGAGCVCVCGNRGAMKELITPGVNGFLADGEDALAQILESLLRYGADDSIRTAGRARAQAFSVERFAAALDDYIEGVG